MSYRGAGASSSSELCDVLTNTKDVQSEVTRFNPIASSFVVDTAYSSAMAASHQAVHAFQSKDAGWLSYAVPI